MKPKLAYYLCLISAIGIFVFAIIIPSSPSTGCSLELNIPLGYAKYFSAVLITMFIIGYYNLNDKSKNT
jgi:hypothetical protein